MKKLLSLIFTPALLFACAVPLSFAQSGQPIASIDFTLNGEKGDSETLGVCVSETNLGDLTADAVAYASGAQIAIVNSGSICASIQAGDITSEALSKAFPHGRTVTTINVTGAQLAEALEWGVHGMPNEALDCFLQVSGISFEVNLDNANGSRVENIIVDGEPIDLEKTYSLAANNYMASGGDGFTMLKTAEVTGSYGTMDDAVASLIETSAENYKETAARITVTQSGEVNINTSTKSAPTLKIFASVIAVFIISAIAGVAYIKRKK